MLTTHERQNYETEVNDHSGTTEPLSVSFMEVGLQTPRPHIRHHKIDSFSKELDYIKQIQSEVETIDTIDEIDVYSYVPGVTT